MKSNQSRNNSKPVKSPSHSTTLRPISKNDSGDDEFQTKSHFELPLVEQSRQGSSSTKDLSQQDLKLTKISEKPSLSQEDSDSSSASVRLISSLTQRTADYADSGHPAKIISALSKQYRVYSSKHFKFGEVFKIKWTEPKNQYIPIGVQRADDYEIIRSEFGEDYYVFIRQFVIVREAQGHSLCLPIFTYGNQGTSKHGVKPQNHAIIYTEDKGRKGEVPKEAPGEVKLTHKPIRMEPKTSRDQLSPYSRLNYAKIYTVEHNVKVCFIGTIHEKSVKEFIKSYNLQHQPIPEDDILPSEEDTTEWKDNPSFQRLSYTFNRLNKEQQSYSIEDLKNKNTESLIKDPESATEPISSPMTLHLNSIRPSDKSLIASYTKSAPSVTISEYGGSTFTHSDEASTTITIDPDPFITFLIDNEHLSAHFVKASQFVLPEILQEKMRYLLLTFGKNLRAEATLNEEKKATYVIERQARDIALDLSRRVYPVRVLRLDDPAYPLQLDLDEWIEKVESVRTEDERIEVDDGHATSVNQEGYEATESDDEGIDILHGHLLQTFIKQSKALIAFREHFEEFLASFEAKSPAREWPTQKSSDRTEEHKPDLAFKNFKFSSLDPNCSVLKKIWPGSDELLAHSIEYQVCWDVLQFLNNYFLKSQQLGNIITLTGDSNDAEALPCSAYLTKTWPAIGSALLAGIEELLRTSTRGYAETNTVKIMIEAPMSSSDVSTTNKSVLKFTVDANFKEHYDVISAITWLCAAIRHGDTEGLSISKSYVETILRTDKTHAILIKLYPLTPISEKGSCWHSLFAHSVIAYDFPISPRKSGHGLELSFQAMLMFAKSLRITDFDGGLVAESLDNLIIPVAYLQEDDALQWHLEWKTSTVSSTEILLGDAFLTRLKTTNPRELIEKRAFLGWTENALVMLGTELFNGRFALENLKRSGALALRNVGFRPVSYNLTLGTNAIPGIFIQAETMIAQAYDGNYTATRGYDKKFRDRLHDSAKRNVIIAALLRKTYWYLPETSAILYMIHIYIKKRGYSILQAEDDDNPFRASALYADPSADGGEAAREVLCKSTKLRLFAEDTSFTMDYLIRKYLFEFELERQEIHQVLKVARELNKAPPSSIVGYELLDVVMETPCLLAKFTELKKSQPWTYLAEEAPILFVKDFGQAIIASSPQTLCDLWKQVPPGRNYLVAAAPAIKYLIESRGGHKLCDQILWDFSDTLIRSHQTGSRLPISHTQTLQCVESSFMPWHKEQRDPWNMILAVINGAFIFGPPLLKKGCIDTLANAGVQNSVEIHADEDGSHGEGITAAQVRSPA